jgi:DNA-binding MarR family transcriptional regulator
VSDPGFLDSLESIIMAGVALTTEALADATHDTELTLPMWRVLVVLGSTEEGATVSEVARRIRVTVPATSRQLQRLAKRGLVSLSVDDHDRRAMRARLTTAGVEFREHVMASRRQRLRVALAPLVVSPTTEHDVAVVARLLGSHR